MSELKKKHPVVLTQTLVWGDMDAFQHINNTVYFRYFEDARIEYFAKIGVMEYMQQNNAGPILASSRCDFRVPLTYPDTIEVTADVKSIQGNRFTMTYSVYSCRQKKLAAEGEGLVVYYDFARGKSTEIPSCIVSAIRELQSPYD